MSKSKNYGKGNSSSRVLRATSEQQKILGSRDIGPQSLARIQESNYFESQRQKYLQKWLKEQGYGDFNQWMRDTPNRIAAGLMAAGLYRELGTTGIILMLMQLQSQVLGLNQKTDGQLFEIGHNLTNSNPGDSFKNQTGAESTGSEFLLNNNSYNNSITQSLEPYKPGSSLKLPEGEVLFSAIPITNKAALREKKNEGKKSKQIQEKPTKPKDEQQETRLEIDIEKYKVHPDKLFVACQRGCDVALTINGIKKIGMDYSVWESFPIFPIHIEDLIELKKQDDFTAFRELMENGVKYLEKEFQKTGRLKNLIVLEYQKLSGTTRLTQDNLGSNIAGKLSEISGIDQKKIKLKIIDGIKKYESGHREMMKLLLSKEMYLYIKDELLLPKIRSVLNGKNLQKQYKNLSKLEVNAEFKQKMVQEFRDVEREGIQNEKYDDRKEKTRQQDVPIIISNMSDQNPNEIHSAESKPAMPAIYNYLGESKDKQSFYEPSSITHEHIHDYEHKICLDGGISISNPMTGKFNEPCGNNIKTYKELPDKILKAYTQDYSKFEKFVGEGDKARKAGKLFTIDELSKALSDYKYPDIDVSYTGKIYTAFDKVFRDTNGITNSLEVIPNLTDEFTPRDLLEFVPNCAHLRSFTIHDDGRNETRLYMNMLQGNVNSVKALIKSNPELLDQKYDGIKLIEVARIVGKYDSLISKDVRLEDAKPRQYMEISKFAEDKYKNKGKSQSSGRDEL